MTALAYETYHLGLRTTRRFIRVPANVISILFFPIIQLLVFSQLYEDIVQLPGFGGDVSYLAYRPRGRSRSPPSSRWRGPDWAADGAPQRLHRQAASRPPSLVILASEMVPLFFQAAAMGGIILISASSLARHRDRAFPVPCSFSPWLASSAWPSRASFIPALITKSEQATSTFSLLLFPLMFASTAFVPEELMLVVAGGEHAGTDQLRDRGHSLADGHQVRLEPDRASAAVDPDHGRNPPGGDASWAFNRVSR